MPGVRTWKDKRVVRRGLRLHATKLAGFEAARQCLRCGDESLSSRFCDDCDSSESAEIIRNFKVYTNTDGVSGFVTHEYVCWLLAKAFKVLTACRNLPSHPSRKKCVEEAENIAKEAVNRFRRHKLRSPGRKFSHAIVGATTMGRKRIYGYKGPGHTHDPDFLFIKASSMGVALLAEVLSATAISNLSDVVSLRDRFDQTCDPSGKTNLVNDFSKLGLGAKNCSKPAHVYLYLKENPIRIWN